MKIESISYASDKIAQEFEGVKSKALNHAQSHSGRDQYAERRSWTLAETCGLTPQQEQELLYIFLGDAMVDDLRFGTSFLVDAYTHRHTRNIRSAEYPGLSLQRSTLQHCSEDIYGQMRWVELSTHWELVAVQRFGRRPFLERMQELGSVLFSYIQIFS